MVTCLPDPFRHQIRKRHLLHLRYSELGAKIPKGALLLNKTRGDVLGGTLLQLRIMTIVINDHGQHESYFFQSPSFLDIQKSIIFHQTDGFQQIKWWLSTRMERSRSVNWGWLAHRERERPCWPRQWPVRRIAVSTSAFFFIFFFFKTFLGDFFG